MTVSDAAPATRASWVAGISALAIIPASRLPGYRAGEIPETVATGQREAD